MSTDLERLIAESKERLGKHKEYLERTAQRGSGTSGVDQPVALSPPRTYSPARFAATATPQPAVAARPMTATSASARPTPTPGSYQQQQQQQQRAAYAAAPRNLSPEFLRGTNPDSPTYSGFNPYSSNIARAGHNNFGDPRSFADGSSPSAGRSKEQRAGFYLSGRPLTKVYERGQKFVGSRAQFLERQRQESWEKQMAECTFSPFVSKRAAKTQGRAQAAIGATPVQTKNQKTSSKSPSHSPSRQGGNNKFQEKSLLDWCVESDKSNVGFHVDAPSVFLHIQRQQDARKAKEEGESKLTIDTSHWVPKLTVPQEFHFGRTDQPIRALRKPMLQMVRLHSDDTDNNGSRPGSVSPGRRARGGFKSPPKRSGSAALVDGDGNDEAAIEARKAEQHRKFVAAQNQAAQQKTQIQQQSDEIAKLNGMIQSLKMESEAAKAKVREMALAQTISGAK